MAEGVVLEGRGNADRPKFCFVGMNPGREEIKQGLPFVGPSGKALNSFLERAGIAEADCFFTNAVRCGTPGNREPSNTEAKEWRDVLIQELQKVRPQIIIPLGNFAFKEIVGKSGITAAAGQPHSPHQRLGLNESTVVPTYHPAFALRNPAMSESIVANLAFAKSLADGTQVKIEPNIVWVDKLRTTQAMENVANKISEAKIITYDIETNKRPINDPEFAVYLISVDTDDWNFVFGPSEKSVRMGAVLVGLHSGAKVGHNSIRFDARGLEKIESSACKALKYDSHDTMLLDYLLDENAASHSLEAATHRVVGSGAWKSMVTWDWADPPEDIPWETAVEYCAKDTRATRLLFDALWPRVESDPGLLREYNDVLRPASVAFYELEQNGVYVDKAYCQEAIETIFRPQVTAAINKMYELVGYEFNPRSGPQLAKALFETLQVKPIHFTSTGKPSADEVTLKTVMELYAPESAPYQFCKAVLDMREAGIIISTFLQKYMDQANDEGMIFPSYGLTTTVTGRTSAFKPNYENVPRDLRVRKMIAAPPGFSLLQADYSQLELRIAAEVAGEQNMLAAFERGDDLHKMFAQFITGKEDVTKEERTTAKIANFLLLYGGEEYTFIENAFKNYGIRFSMTEARRLRDAFFQMWPGLDAWYARVADELKETGQVRTLLGQIRRLPQFFASDPQDRLEALRQGINTTVQTPASKLGIIAVGMVNNAFKAKPLVEWATEKDLVACPDIASVCGFVHDALHARVKEQYVEQAALTIKRIMEKQVPDFLAQGGVCIKVPLVADVEVGPSWGELKKMTFSNTTLLSA